MPIPRRNFLRSAVSGCSAFAGLMSFRMGWGSESGIHPASLQAGQSESTPPAAVLHPVAAGQDRFGVPRSLGISSLAFKVATNDSAGNLFVVEHRGLEPGKGPALHLHYSQEEWFYVMEGEVAFAIGDQRLNLRAGESILAPRRLPHTFSAVGSPAHMLIAFAPAGKMEQYFIDGAANPAASGTDEFMGRYEMKLIGPSPFWKS